LGGGSGGKCHDNVTKLPSWIDSIKMMEASISESVESPPTSDTAPTIIQPPLTVNDVINIESTSMLKSIHLNIELKEETKISSKEKTTIAEEVPPKAEEVPPKAKEEPLKEEEPLKAEEESSKTKEEEPPKSKVEEPPKLEEEEPPKTNEEAPPMTPRSKKRFDKAESRRKAKEKRDADRAKAKEDRAKAKASLKGLSGEERDEARRKMKEDADRKRKEQAMDRKADLEIQKAMDGPDDGKPVRMSKEVMEHLAKKKKEEEIAAAKQALLDEERRIREAELAKITCAHQENDRYSSRVRIQISKSGTNWGSWHSRYASLGYRELRIYNRYENIKPTNIYRIPLGSVCRYIPILKTNGGIVENPDKVGGFLHINIISAQNLRNADGLFGKSDPYCEIFLNNKLITRSTTIQDTLNPMWKHYDTIDIAPSDLHRGKWKLSTLTVIVYDEDENGEPDFLGQVLFHGKDLIKLLHHSSEPVTIPLMNRPNAKIGIMGSERKAKGSITIQMNLTSKETPDRPRVLEFGLKEVEKGSKSNSNNNNNNRKDSPLKLGQFKKSKKKKKRKGKRNSDGQWIPDIVPLTGLDRRGIGTTPARHNGSESIIKTAKDRIKERDANPSKIRIRMQLPSIKVARKWIYVLIEYFPNVVTYLHTTKIALEKEKPEKDETVNGIEEDELESVFTNITVVDIGVNEEVKDVEEEKVENEKVEERTKEGKLCKTVHTTTTTTTTPSLKKTQRIKVYRKIKKIKRESPPPIQNKVIKWENDMKLFFKEISTIDGQGIKFNLFTLLTMIMGTYHDGRIKYKRLPPLSNKSIQTMKQWKPLKLLLSPKTYKIGIERLIKKEDSHKKYKTINIDWEHLVLNSGLLKKSAKYKMQHRDSTRKEMISAAEVQRQKDRELAAIARKKREEREKKEKLKKFRRLQQQKKEKLRALLLIDRENHLQLEKEEAMGVPHEHLCVTINNNTYCPICRQLAWQKANDKWHLDEKKKREQHNQMIVKLRKDEEELKKEKKIKIRLAASTPLIKRNLKNVEKMRRNTFLKLDEMLVQKESSRRDEWNHADQKHRSKERYLRPIESKALRLHTQHRSTWLSAVSIFRDRTIIARLLWQKLLDKQNSFSSGNMRHLVWDESFEEFRIGNFISCNSKPSADMIMKRALTIKHIGINCNDLVRVRNCWYQPGEGASGNGFVALVLLDYIGNPKTDSSIEYYIRSSNIATKLTELTVLKWGRSVANGIQYMHRNNIIHGNVKPSNIFLSNTNDAKLGDYPFFKSRFEVTVVVVPH
jgi:hypothetical protein